MGLFGTPNIDRLQKKGHISKLISLQTNSDAHIVKKALAALKHILDNKELAEQRKKHMSAWEYSRLIKKFDKLSRDKQQQLSELRELLIEEKKLRDESDQAIATERQELKKQFESVFKSTSGTTDDFWVKLMNILGGNKEIKYHLTLPGRYSMSSFSGIIISDDVLVYFELNLAPKVVGIRFEETKSFSVTGGINKYLKIEGNDGAMIKIAVDETDAYFIEIITFIECRVTKTGKHDKTISENSDAVSEQLQEIEDKLKDPVAWNLQNGDKKTRNNAALSLLNAKRADAAELILTQILKENPEVKSNSFLATSDKQDLLMTLAMNFKKLEKNEKTLEAYINVLSSNDASVIGHALIALEKLANPKAIEPLESLTQKGVVGLKAGVIEKSIKRIKKKNGIPN